MNMKKRNSSIVNKEKDLKDLKFYTCIKTPEKHFIIFDLRNNLIYHMIGNFRE